MYPKTILLKVFMTMIPGYLIVMLPTMISNAPEINPCDLLSDQLIEEFFEVKANDISREQSSSSNPSCTVEWAKPNIEDLKQKHQEALAQYMEDKITGKDAKMPAYSGNCKVGLTIYGSDFKDNLTAKNSFNTAMQRLEEGITREVNGKMKTMFQYETVQVEDVADDAYWVKGLSQLSVLSGLKIFHLRVRVYDSSVENIKSVKAIASRLAESLH